MASPIRLDAARRRFGLSLAASAVLVGAGVRPGLAASPLNAFAWTHRPLLLFAPRLDTPALARQLQLLEGAAAALSEREAPVLVVLPDRTLIEGAEAPISAAALRRIHGVAPDAFAVILIGKDTGVKLRETRPTPVERVLDLIDAMPMRRREMRERAG